MLKKICFKHLYSGLTLGLVILLHATVLFAGNVTLAWDPPTTNEDGTPLTDLAGFIIYYGTTSGDYSQSIDVGNVTTYQVSNLTEGLTYYFAATAYDTSGNESEYSYPEAVATMAPPPPPSPEITVTDSVAPTGDLQIPFGNVTEGSSSNQTVTVTSDGNAELVIGYIAQNNPLSAPFSILNDYCSGQTLSPSSNCTLTVRFSPTATGLFNDSFDIPSSDSDENPVTVSVNGTGEAIPVPDITVTDSVAPTADLQIPFGDLTEWLSRDRVVTIANDGSADLAIGYIAQNNPLSAPFSILNDYCSGQTLTPSSNCTLTVRFSPTIAGLFNDSFDIPSNDSDENPVTISVSGTGLPADSNNPPAIPELIFPADNQEGLGTTIEFKWKESTDPDEDTVTYDLYACEYKDLTIGCITATDIAFRWSEGISYASIGSYGTWLLFFGMGILPVLLGVTRNRRKIALLIAVITIATVFLVSCGGGGGGGTGDSSGGTTSDSFNGVSQVVSGFSVDTAYHWKIVAKDSYGGETESEIWSFITAE